MEQSSLTAHVNWVIAGMLGVVAVGAFSVLILFSYGGQLMVAPALLPVQWLIARHTRGWMSPAFAVLGALLLLESVWLGFTIAFGDGTAAIVAGGVLGLLGGLLFYRTSRKPD